MEAVAAASSITGLISLTGQLLDGVIKLRAFFANCAAASKTIDRFLRDLNSLIQTIEDVKDLVVKLTGVSISTWDNHVLISSLQIQLEDCSKDVYEWVRVASGQHASFSSGGKALFKKFLVAANKDSLTDIFKELSSYRDGFNLKLGLIGRSLDINHATSLGLLDAKLSDMTEATVTGDKVTADALQRLEAQLAASREYLDDTPSLRSLASSISRIESMLSSQPGSPVSYQGSFHGSSGGDRRNSYDPARRRGSSVKSDTRSNLSSVGSHRRPDRPSKLPTPSQTDSNIFFKWKSSLPKKVTTDTFMEERKMVEEGLAAFGEEREMVKNPLERQAPSSLLQSYEKLLDSSQSACPELLLAYINLAQFSRTIKLHAKLVASIRTSHVDVSDDQFQESEEFRELEKQLAVLDQEIETARNACWEEGYDLGHLDMVLESGCTHEMPGTWPLFSKDIKANNGDLRALQHRLEKLRALKVWTVKQDRVNQWLLQRLLASPDDAALHRSLIPDGQKLGEQEWARKVLKHWPLDGAAVHLDDRKTSTHGGIDSGKGGHSVKVLLEIMELANSVESGSDYDQIADLRRRALGIERPGSPLKDVASNGSR